MNLKLSIIIVSYNVKDRLRDNLKALFESAVDFDYEVFVVDNDSKDASAEMVAEDFPSAKLIANKENLGFAKANNQALRQAKGEYVLLLNPDMRLMPDTLEKMVTWMDSEPWAKIAGCKLIDEKGNIVRHVRRFPSVWDQLAVILKIPHVFPGILDKYLRKNFDYGKPALVDSIRGGFMMIRKTMIDAVGYLDERYFLWFEEVDYCRKAHETKAGVPLGEVWYTPAAVCVDYVGQSFRQLPRGQAQKYFRDSMLKYFKKWHPAWQYWLLRSVWPIGMLIAAAGEKLKIKPGRRT